MRILFLLTQDLESPSGLGRYRPLAGELVRLGHQVRIAALHPNMAALEQTSQVVDGVRVDYVAPMHVQKQGNEKSYYSSPRLLWLAVQAAWKLTQVALNTQYDIVHVGKPHPMNSLAGLAAKTRRRTVLYLDCDDYEAGSGRFGAGWQRGGVAWFEKRIPSIARMVTTNTCFMRDKLVSWGVIPERIYYLPNGVPRERFISVVSGDVQSLRLKLGLVDKKVIAYIGSLSLPSHPVDLLIKAFLEIRQHHPDAMLLMVGGGEDFQPLKDLVRQMGISDAVLFTGRIPPGEVPLYYHLADVSVDPIRDDDAARGRSPLKLFESWASGTPFVTSGVGDRQSLIGVSGAGLLAQPGDPRSLAQEIIQVLSNPALAESLSQRGLEEVRPFYWDQLVKGLDQVYRSQITGNP